MSNYDSWLSKPYDAEAVAEERYEAAEEEADRRNQKLLLEGEDAFYDPETILWEWECEWEHDCD